MAAHAPVVVAAGAAPASGDHTPVGARTIKPEAPSSPAVQAYQNDVIGARLKEYLGKSEECGGLIAEHVRPLFVILHWIANPNPLPAPSPVSPSTLLPRRAN